MIDTALARHPEAVAQGTVRLWERLAPELISIIGEGGFKPLYSRSLRLACVQYPWMAPGGVVPSGQGHFAELQARLQAQDPAQASHASNAFFNIFLDLLASLIGEVLTTHLLHSAWSQETSEIPAKDL
ncbi:MAG: hypothetical protein JWP96_1274 [Polaromonas sp.]|nr:hypothetical protein [Polaromonas sp.]